MGDGWGVRKYWVFVGGGIGLGLCFIALLVVGTYSAAAGIAGASGAETVPEDPDATRQRLGDAFAEALLLDQQASGGKARSIGGWRPTRPSLLDELRR